MAKVLDGKSLAEQIETDLKTQVASLDYIPTLVTMLVGNNPSSQMYIKMKVKACERIGIQCIQEFFPEEDIPQHIVEGRIRTYNYNPTVHGILLQHPVPNHLDERSLFDTIAVEKDVDGVSAESFTRLAYKRPGFKPATPYGIMKLLKYYNISVCGKVACVVGCSSILGKPLSLMLENDGCTTIMCNKFTCNGSLKRLAQQSDIIIGACGVPSRIPSSWIDTTKIIIDCGYPKSDFEQGVGEKSQAFTPHKGGVGPLTIATLLTQVVESAKRGSDGY